jgi:predicted nucleic acid-binding protein
MGSRHARRGCGRTVRTAIDTNVLSAIWSRERNAQSLSESLAHLMRQGTLRIAPVVLSELLAYPGATETFIRNFLTDTMIKIDFELDQQVWLEAGRRFAQHVVRRRAAASHEPKRLLPDYIVGAHALLHADQLMTLDSSRFKRDFPELRLLPEPAQ